MPRSVPLAAGLLLGLKDRGRKRSRQLGGFLIR